MLLLVLGWGWLLFGLLAVLLVRLLVRLRVGLRGEALLVDVVARNGGADRHEEAGIHLRRLLPDIVGYVGRPTRNEDSLSGLHGDLLAVRRPLQDDLTGL